MNNVTQLLPKSITFVIGIDTAHGTLKLLHKDLTVSYLSVPLDLENPATLGHSLELKGGFACSGNDCLHYTEFEDLSTPVMLTPEWKTLLHDNVEWKGWGTITEAVIASDYPNIVYLPGLSKACEKPTEMDPTFTGNVFAYRAGNLGLQLEPTVNFGWIESLVRTPDNLIEVGIVFQSQEGWSPDIALAKRAFLLFSEQELLIKWNTRFLNTSFIGKAINDIDGTLLMQYPPHPVPAPVYEVQVQCNHPFAANYVVDAETNSLKLVTDIVIRNGARGDYTTGL